MKIWEVGQKAWIMGADYSCKRGIIVEKTVDPFSCHKDNRISYVIRFEDGKTVRAFGYQMTVRIPAAKKLFDSMLLGW